MIKKTINIAEFGIKPSFRRKGYGILMVNMIEQWAIDRGFDSLNIEVDKELIRANSFWGTFNDLELNSSGNRNFYYRKLSR
ncbi:MAG: GNAT family N-acetyltransferase [Chlamydiota bacterium]